MKTIMVKNGKGGEGKSIISINLAAVLAESYRVLHIDTDPRCSSTNFWMKQVDVPATGTLGEWITNKKSSEQVINHTAYNNLDFISCSDDLEDYINEIEKNKFMNLGGTNLLNKLKEISSEYDYRIIDCSQNADTMAVNTFIASDLVLIPCCCAESSYNGMKEMLIWISQVQNMNTSLNYKVLINNREKNNEHLQIIERIKETAAENLISTYIRHQSKPISLSQRTGVPIVYMRRSKKEIERTTIADDLRNFVKEVI